MLKQSVSPQIQSFVKEPSLYEHAERLSLVRHERKNKNKKDDGFLSLVPGGKHYTLVFGDDSLPDNHGACNVVKVNSVNEVMIYYGLLGATCEMYLSPEYFCSHKERVEELEKIKASPAGGALDAADAEIVAELLRKLPLDIAGLLESPLAVKDEDVVPGIVDPEVIHKKNPANALLSEPFYAGRFVYYNMLGHTEEFRFDHESDHVQGMLILEAMRQAALATTHLAGDLPSAGGMTLMSYCTNFYNYIEHNAPVILRAYTSYTVPEEISDKDGFVICQVFQWGKLCTEAVLGAVAFMNKERYGKHRARTEKLSARNKRLFASKIQAMSELVNS